MQLERTLRSGPQAPGQARELVRDLPLANGARSRLELIVTELVSNSVVHGGDGTGEVTVTLRTDDVGVEGKICDAGDGFDWQPHAPDLTEPGGLGLALVDELSERWGVRRDSSACVWFVYAVA